MAPGKVYSEEMKLRAIKADYAELNPKSCNDANQEWRHPEFPLHLGLGAKDRYPRQSDDLAIDSPNWPDYD